MSEPTEAEITGALAELFEAELAGTAEKAEIRIGPFSAFVLIGLIQFAWRHPGLSPRHKQIAHDIVDQLATLFGPPLDAAIELGWDTTRDVPLGGEGT